MSILLKSEVRGRLPAAHPPGLILGFARFAISVRADAGSVSKLNPKVGAIKMK
jgi:hypothetical protein